MLQELGPAEAPQQSLGRPALARWRKPRGPARVWGGLWGCELRCLPMPTASTVLAPTLGGTLRPPLVARSEVAFLL